METPVNYVLRNTFLKFTFCTCLILYQLLWVSYEFSSVIDGKLNTVFGTMPYIQVSVSTTF